MLFDNVKYSAFAKAEYYKTLFEKLLNLDLYFNTTWQF
ncbi:hypothetical protein DDD_0543 [Nonlabens dokdonensis DSW-6]|uniref:Uncharacterized protein n=1 Tax=Nonlabens dokdonensis (strain DSM 17205 / KCTC 12402 / DSW-6) TaxID=592029 RepID=L7W2E5_NONDD|nr:hypothetical protein DDD_0543 [Nonlabens dokdonensis DSW-6]